MGVPNAPHDIPKCRDRRDVPKNHVPKNHSYNIILWQNMRNYSREFYGENRILLFHSKIFAIYSLILDSWKEFVEVITSLLKKA